MANQILIKRGTGTSALANGELGYNTSTNTLYIGNNGNKAIGGSGAFLPLSGGTLTGKLRMLGTGAEIVNSVWPVYGFASDATGEIVNTGGIYQSQSSRRVGFQQIAEGSAQSEDYLLPTPSQQEERKWYNILTSKNPVTIAQGGTGATTATGACDSIGAVKKSGDVMTGNLIVPYLSIRNNDGWMGIDLFDEDGNYRAGYSCDESNRVFIRQKNKDMADGEYFCFSPPTTSGHWYNILTTKNPVSIAQGGTGATTAADARKNLAVPYYAKYDAGNLQTGANNISAWVSYYGDDGTNYNQMDLTKTATVFRKPVDIASGGTGATSASGACTNLGAVKKSGDAMTGQLSISHNSFHTLKLIASSSNTAKEASIGFFQDTTEAWTLGVATGSNGTTDFGLYAAGHGLAFKVGKASSDPITLYRHLNSTTSGNFGNSLQVGSNAKRQVLLYSGDDHAKISNQDASWFEYNAMYMYDTHTYFKKPIQVLTQQYWIEGKYGVNMDNSDIINANGIYFTDDSNAAGEGINFSRSSTTWDTLVASGGKLYFAPNRATSEVGTRYEVYHSGGSVVPVSKGGTGLSQLTAGEVVVGNGTSVPTSRKIVHNTTVGNLGWSNNSNALTTLSTLAYWDGAYSGNNSNLTKLGTVTQGTWHASTIGVTYGGTGVTTTAGLRNLVHNSYSDAGIANTVDVFTLAPGIYHCEDTTSTDKNYPIAESRATVEVFGQYRTGTAAGDGYANGYWTVRITYASGKQFTNHRYWSAWSGWKTTYNSSSVIYSSSQPTGAQGMIWLKPIS